jgi:hypothetical protein
MRFDRAWHTALLIEDLIARCPGRDMLRRRIEELLREQFREEQRESIDDFIANEL